MCQLHTLQIVPRIVSHFRQEISVLKSQYSLHLIYIELPSSQPHSVYVSESHK